MGSFREIPLINKTVLFENCDDMTIWDYIQVVKNKDLKLLVKRGPVPSKKRLSDRWEQINKEFATIRGEDNTAKIFDLIQYKEELILQVHFGAALSDLLQTQIALRILAPATFEALIKELEDWGFCIDKELPLIESLEIIKSEIDALQMTIDALHEEIYPTQEEGEDAEDNKEKEASTLGLHTLLLVYGRIIKKSIPPKETSLTEFAAIEKDVNEIKKIANNSKDND